MNSHCIGTEKTNIERSLQDKNPKLFATDLMDFAYCKRLFYIKKMMHPPLMDNSASICGTVEHEVRRTAIKFLQPEYEVCDSKSDLKNLDYARPIRDALDYAFDLGEKRYPEHIRDIELMLPELSFRLLIEERQRIEQALALADRNVKLENIVERIFPWAIELGVGSSVLGITGRIDQVYRRNKNLTPVDFKTHVNRFSSLIWRNAHVEQVATYALLLELQYKGYRVSDGYVKYTQDLFDYPINIPRDNKHVIISHIREARIVLNDKKTPPRLQGLESVKCNHCHLKDYCFAINDMEVNP